ncbi:succinate dehydrogenase assembly factor 2 [Ferrovum sp. PN-J185]|uniref:FAD assembly factor SdhE n=1 Tax=Ferrovum sp. PN-J185 TaxID=1356306 RepID=UPI001E5565AC|nr:succinate dehydrogenase assembly factor 2 [Ferrovum sp. PN-J185]MCC6069280.1 succinate dehydrogenase assembly factor 2 [Ferrovum sp. PN-J185]MDE1891420.1 succinate dehydrogenase assembly factor 2 [Betaproteobacteria bacterium]MDE2056054.1 succinate dehydrogenase assembly factor 2 [Betaproteobacteria bacterium]
MLLDKNRKERILWRSRRGLLEMDLILERFLSKHLDTLTEEEITVYDGFLQLSDNDFLDMAMGRKDPQEILEIELMNKIRNS